jgi:AraC-like DNA-binding protein
MKIDFKPFCSPFYFGEGTASIFYSSHITPLHCHDTLQLIFDIKDKFLFRTKNTDWKKYKSVIIQDNIIHQLNTNNSLQLILYLDKTTTIAKKIQQKYLKGPGFCDPGIELALLEEDLLYRNLLNPKTASLQILIALILNRVLDLCDEVFTDKRITKTLQLIKETNSAELSINYLADKVFISSSRLRMLSKKHTGFSLHKYIIRHKILSAITEIINGSTIRDAGFNAGFNDASHFNKMLSKLYGTTPSRFLKENKSFNLVKNENVLLALNTKIFC